MKNHEEKGKHTRFPKLRDITGVTRWTAQEQRNVRYIPNHQRMVKIPPRLSENNIFQT